MWQLAPAEAVQLEDGEMVGGAKMGSGQSTWLRRSYAVLFDETSAFIPHLLILLVYCAHVVPALVDVGHMLGYAGLGWLMLALCCLGCTYF